MRNINEVLQQKERDLERVRQEVEALRLVAPLLAGDSKPITPDHKGNAELHSPRQWP